MRGHRIWFGYIIGYIRVRMPRMTLSDDDLRHTYNRAVAATDKPYPDAYLEGLRALVAAGWGEGYADGFGDGGVNAWDPANPYRGDGGE